MEVARKGTQNDPLRVRSVAWNLDVPYYAWFGSKHRIHLTVERWWKIIAKGGNSNSVWIRIAVTMVQGRVCMITHIARV